MASDASIEEAGRAYEERFLRPEPMEDIEFSQSYQDTNHEAASKSNENSPALSHAQAQQNLCSTFHDQGNQTSENKIASEALEDSVRSGIKRSADTTLIESEVVENRAPPLPSRTKDTHGRYAETTAPRSARSRSRGPSQKDSTIHDSEIKNETSSAEGQTNPSTHQESKPSKRERSSSATRNGSRRRSQDEATIRHTFSHHLLTHEGQSVNIRYEDSSPSNWNDIPHIHQASNFAWLKDLYWSTSAKSDKRQQELEKENRDLRRHIEVQNERMTSIKNFNVQMERQIAYLKQHNKRLKDDNLAKEKDIYNMGKQRDTQINQYLRQVNHLQTNTDSYDTLLAPEKDDSHWKPVFGAFRNRINTWSLETTNNFPTVLARGKPSTITPEIEKEILCVVPTPGGTVDDVIASLNGRLYKKKRRFFLQGWLHLVLCGTVFPSSIPDCPDLIPTGTDIWLPKMAGDALQALEAGMGEYFEHDLASFHKWRTLTLSLLNKTNPDGKIYSKSAAKVALKCQQMAEVLFELCTSSSEGNFYGELTIDEVKSELIEIFKEATKISSLLRTQRGAFAIRFPIAETGSPLHLDKTWMDVDKDEKMTVDYVIEPAVLKAGNGQGQDYDKVGVFLKAKVACFREKKPIEDSSTHT